MIFLYVFYAKVRMQRTVRKLLIGTKYTTDQSQNLALEGSKVFRKVLCT
jgi:hypothetical protein